jgi:hypothetical protein
VRGPISKQLITLRVDHDKVGQLEKTVLKLLQRLNEPTTFKEKPVVKLLQRLTEPATLKDAAHNTWNKAG